MNIAENCVVSMEYELTDPSGTVLDTTKDREIFSYIHGSGMIIQGLEDALKGKQTGDDISITIEPDDAYGPVNQELIQPVPREHFDNIENLMVGMQLEIQSDEMNRVVTVTDINDTNVTIDANHPLAGVTLNFAVQIVEVREATVSELEKKRVDN